MEQDSSKCSVLIDVAFVIKQVLCTQPDPENIRLQMVIGMQTEILDATTMVSKVSF